MSSTVNNQIPPRIVRNDIVLENHPELTHFSIIHHGQPRLVVRQYYWLALICVTNFKFISNHGLDRVLPGMGSWFYRFTFTLLVLYYTLSWLKMMFETWEHVSDRAGPVFGDLALPLNPL